MECAYRPGWSAELSLAGALESVVERDLERGSTSVGPHRGELRVLLDGAPVKARASRGQQKLAAAALTLAQVELFDARRGDSRCYWWTIPLPNWGRSTWSASSSNCGRPRPN